MRTDYEREKNNNKNKADRRDFFVHVKSVHKCEPIISNGFFIFLFGILLCVRVDREILIYLDVIMGCDLAGGRLPTKLCARRCDVILCV